MDKIIEQKLYRDIEVKILANAKLNMGNQEAGDGSKRFVQLCKKLVEIETKKKRRSLNDRKEDK